MLGDACGAGHVAGGHPIMRMRGRSELLSRTPSCLHTFLWRHAVPERSHTRVYVFLPMRVEAEDNVANTFGRSEKSSALHESVVNWNAIVRQYCVREIEPAPVKHSREVDCRITYRDLTP